MYKRILVPIDLDQESSWQKALPVAREYCQIFGSSLDLLTVLPDFGVGLVGNYFPPDFEEKATAEALSRLEDLARERLSGSVKVRCHVAHGTVYEQILEKAQELNIDLIVMASHRPELSDYLLGPNAARVVRHSEVSVLVVRN